MNPFSTMTSQTQRNVGIVRPRLYEIDEVAEELGITRGVAMRLVHEFSIKPSFNKRPYKYSLHHFQEALNQKAKTELYKVQKGIPLPPKRVSDPLNEAITAVMSMQAGESMLVPTKAVPNIASRARRMGAKVATRNMRDGTYRIWMIEPAETKETP